MPDLSLSTNNQGSGWTAIKQETRPPGMIRVFRTGPNEINRGRPRKFLNCEPSRLLGNSLTWLVCNVPVFVVSRLDILVRDENFL